MMLGMTVMASFSVMVLVAFSMTMPMMVVMPVGLSTLFFLRGINIRVEVHWDGAGNDLRKASCQFFEIIEAKTFVRAMSVGLRT